jgi:hypothetical protein
MIDPILCFKAYIGIKLHYETNYSIIENKGRVANITLENFEKNSARKAMLLRVAKRSAVPYNAAEYFIAQYVAGSGAACFDPQVGDENHDKYLLFKHSATTKILSDLAPMPMIYWLDGEPPNALKEAMRGSIHIQTASVLNSLIPFINMESQHYGYHNVSGTIVKTLPFIKYDRNRVLRELEIVPLNTTPESQ